MIDNADLLLAASGLKKHFRRRKKLFAREAPIVRAVDGVDFSLRSEEVFGLVGESGSGKTTIGYMIARIYKPTAGTIQYRGIDINGARKEKLKWLRREMQIVFQDPGGTLNPRKTIKEILALPLQTHKVGSRKERSERILRLLEMVDLPSAYIDKYPSGLSGGQKQRVAIARALALGPSFIVLDEPTSALDVSVQGKVLCLLVELKRTMGLTYLFITHDLSVIRNIASRVAVMYGGKVFEVALVDELFAHPKHPYTQLLLSSIPVMSPEERLLLPSSKSYRRLVSTEKRTINACAFYERCAERKEVCSQIAPEMRMIGNEHSVRCFLYQTMSSYIKDDIRE